MDKDYLAVGKIVGSRGISGELKIDCLCDSPEVFVSIKNFFVEGLNEPLAVVNLRIYKSRILMKLDSVNNTEQSECLKGKIVYALKKDIPLEDNCYFIEDLKGCSIIDASNDENYGTLGDVFNRGASDIYRVMSFCGKEYLLPIIEGTIEKIDLGERKIYVNPLRGVFDDN